MKILIVEDEALLAMDLELQVEDAGHQVCAVVDHAEKALVEARRCNPDLALMDVRLAGGSSGVDAARTLWRRLGIRCIFVSGSLDEHVRRDLQECAPIAFLPKPVSPQRLRRALEAASARMVEYREAV